MNGRSHLRWRRRRRPARRFCLDRVPSQRQRGYSRAEHRRQRPGLKHALTAAVPEYLRRPFNKACFGTRTLKA
eukprot:6190519-Pleurochrysis_carterae.AAC.1